MCGARAQAPGDRVGVLSDFRRDEDITLCLRDIDLKPVLLVYIRSVASHGTAFQGLSPPSSYRPLLKVRLEAQQHMLLCFCHVAESSMLLYVGYSSSHVCFDTCMLHARCSFDIITSSVMVMTDQGPRVPHMHRSSVCKVLAWAS